MTKLDRTLRRRYHQWRKQENDLYRLPVGISDDGYLLAQHGSAFIAHWVALGEERQSYRDYDIDKTPILAFPPGYKGEGNTTAIEWQRSQLPKSMNMSAYLLFQYFCQSEDPDVFLEPTPIPERLTIGMGKYVSVVLECDRSITIYPTPSAFEDLTDLLKMKPNDASYELFEDLVCNGWEIDIDSCYTSVTEDGFFHPGDGEQFWAYGWIYKDYVFRCLHEDILLRGEATMHYYRNELLSDRQQAIIRQAPDPDDKSLARKLAEACGLEVIID